MISRGERLGSYSPFSSRKLAICLEIYVQGGKKSSSVNE